MIPVKNPIRKPGNFMRDCESKGNAWLAKNPGSNKFPDHWRKFQPQLAIGFHDRCGWWAMRIADGAVDHYLSKESHRHLAYDWSNYRYISPSVNSSKGNLDDQILDPFVIQAGWFEVLLPSMILKRTALVPAALQAKADFTLDRLRLVRGYKVRRNRRAWYEGYRNGLITKAGLREYAPLVAEAVDKWEAAGRPLP